jgi:hypothetical protein
LNEANFECKNAAFEDEDTSRFKKESLHIFGVDELSTQDVFDFFKQFKPFAVEWINDNSCNVVWKKDVHTALALYYRSLPFDVNNSSSGSTDYEAMCNEFRDRCQPMYSDKTLRWRLCGRSDKGYAMFTRFARVGDRKQKGAEKRSNYYLKYGNPNYGNIRGLISHSYRQKFKTGPPTIDNENRVDPSGRKLVSYDICKFDSKFNI